MEHKYLEENIERIKQDYNFELGSVFRIAKRIAKYFNQEIGDIFYKDMSGLRYDEMKQRAIDELPYDKVISFVESYYSYKFKVRKLEFMYQVINDTDWTGGVYKDLRELVAKDKKENENN